MRRVHHLEHIIEGSAHADTRPHQTWVALEAKVQAQLEGEKQVLWLTQGRWAQHKWLLRPQGSAKRIDKTMKANEVCGQPLGTQA
jgi:hypothetical protein